MSCHLLSHTLATQLLNAEAEIETIQDLLGHNWITTTQRYCKVSNLKLQTDYFKTMRRIQQLSVQPILTQCGIQMSKSAFSDTRMPWKPS